MESRELLKQRTKEAEAVIEVYLPSEESFQKTVLEAMNSAMRAPGKRLRPILMRETYRLFGGAGKEIEPFMAAIEMIHTSSLIHDDLPCMDNDTLRRGLPTTWVTYGYDFAVLAGDALMINAFATAAKAYEYAKDVKRVVCALRLLAEKSGIYGMVGGQTVDVEMTGKPVSPEQLDFIYSLKTAALIEAAMMTGAILAGASDEDVRKVEEMAHDVGLAFQIQDDILDVTGSADQLGKPALSDEKNEKTTYVTVYGLEAARSEVAALSEEATDILESLGGEGQFLEDLIRMLITREN